MLDLNIKAMANLQSAMCETGAKSVLLYSYCDGKNVAIKAQLRRPGGWPKQKALHLKLEVDIWVEDV